jgi:hypothetical protein
MLKKLSFEDSDLISEILPPREIEVFNGTYLSGLHTWLAYGWFKNDKLVGISTAYHDGNTQEWFLLKQHADRAEDMEDMISQVCTEFENKGVYKLFWLDTDYSVDFMKNYIPGYYHHYKEYSIPPYALPKNLLHWNILMNNNFIATNSHIYMSVLSNDYKKN